MADTSETGPNAVNKGGGYKGGPKRWAGRGPAPARHIPWPELFKHHISLIEGHQKMIDMVRKHTVEGTGNHRTICEMLDRCKTMLYESKNISRNFVPRSNLRDQVPIGSSSASMYPGYSPADHVYGTAAQEAGKAATEAKRQGIELKPSGDIEYEIGQGSGLKRRKLADMRAAKAAKSGSGSGSGPDADMAEPATNGHGQEVKPARAKDAENKATEGEFEDAQPAFFIDTKPTPINLPFAAKKPSKRTSPDIEPAEEVIPKKVKQKHEGHAPAAPEPGQIETEDISAEVDKRMKEKEEKRKKKEEQKKEKKRKRDIEGSSGLAAEASVTTVVTEKPKKKKSKKDHEAKEAEEDSKKRPAEAEEAVADTEGKKKKRKKYKDGSSAP